MLDIHGSISDGFERVQQVFADMSADLAPGGGALAVYHRGRLVVDLWCGEARPGVPWEENTRGVLMSATKGAAALCCALLVERGDLRPDKRVMEYWPEFGANGKADITVAQILDHSAGTITFPGYDELLDWDGRGWGESVEIQRRIAEAKPEWVPGCCHGYHGLTCGWQWDYLVQRITGLTTGEFFQREFASKLGLDFVIGSPEPVIANTAHCIELDMNRLTTEMRELFEPLMNASSNESTLTGKAFFARNGVGVLHRIAQLMNNPRVLEVEISAANGTATARSIARMYALLANSGELDDLRLLRSETLADFCEERRNEPDVVLGQVVSRGLGFELNRISGPLGEPMGPHPQAFGHSGAGGQQAFADPVAKIGVGLLRNALTLNPVHGLTMIEAIYASPVVSA